MGIKRAVSPDDGVTSNQPCGTGLDVLGEKQLPGLAISGTGYRNRFRGAIFTSVSLGKLEKVSEKVAERLKKRAPSEGTANTNTAND